MAKEGSAEKVVKDIPLVRFVRKTDSDSGSGSVSSAVVE